MSVNGVMGKRAVLVSIVGLVLTSGCAGAASSEPLPYEDVDPNTSEYFIALEDEGSEPLTYAGGQPSADTEFLYNMGLFFCDEMDGGASVEEALVSLGENSGLGDKSGSVAGAAVNDMCPQHREAAEEFADSQ